MDNKLLCTEGAMYLDELKWAKEAPLAGFILKVDGKQICGLNFVATSSIITEEDAKTFPSLLEHHFTPTEAKANAERIIKAWNSHDMAKDLLSDLVKMVNDVTYGDLVWRLAVREKAEAWLRDNGGQF